MVRHPTALDELRLDDDDRAGSEGSRRWPWLMLAGAVLLLGGIAISHRLCAAPTPPLRTALVHRTTPGGGDDAVLNASGYVTARRKATVSSKITGRIVELLFEEGSAVEKGQLLARLDDDLALPSVRQAEAALEATRLSVGETEAQLEEAKRQLGRARRLLSEGVIGPAERDTAEAAVQLYEARRRRQWEEIEVASRRLALERKRLERTRILAPFSGVVISKDAQPGEMVSPISAGGGFTRTGICTLVDMRSLEIEVDVGESYIGRVEPGQPVSAALDAYPDWSIPGRVITLVPAADRQRATVRVRIAFDELDPRLLPDMGVRVSFLSPEEAAGNQPEIVLLVPHAALRQAGDRRIVFVVNGGKAERRAVATGKTRGEEVIVLSGLSEGERVVLDPPAELEDGDEIR